MIELYLRPSNQSFRFQVFTCRGQPLSFSLKFNNLIYQLDHLTSSNGPTRFNTFTCLQMAPSVREGFAIEAVAITFQMDAIDLSQVRRFSYIFEYVGLLQRAHQNITLLAPSTGEDAQLYLTFWSIVSRKKLNPNHLQLMYKAIVLEGRLSITVHGLIADQALYRPSIPTVAAMHHQLGNVADIMNT